MGNRNHPNAADATATAAVAVAVAVAERPMPDASAPSPSGRPRTTRSRHGNPSFVSRFAVVGVWATTVLVYTVINGDKFFHWGTFRTVFGSQQALVFVALGVVWVLVVGEFDLSVASVLGLSATLVPVLNVLHGVNVVLSIVIALAAAIAVGVVNGGLVVAVHVNPIVATLGTGTLSLGVALWLTDMNTVGGLSRDLAKISTWRLWSLPISFYYGLALAFVFAYTLRYTPLGRHMIFVGANREVARLAGIRVDRIRFGSYIASATLSGIGGVVLVAGLGGFDPSISQSYLLPAFSAVFLGTAVIQPGRFNPLGTIVAIYFLVTGILGLQIMGLSGWIEQVFYGGALVVAVSTSTLLRRREGAA